jgi:hypothetical protein
MFTFYYSLANYLKISVHLSAHFGKEDVTSKKSKLSTGTTRNSMATRFIQFNQYLVSKYSAWNTFSGVRMSISFSSKRKKGSQQR